MPPDEKSKCSSATSSPYFVNHITNLLFTFRRPIGTLTSTFTRGTTMAATLTIRDESAGGKTLHELTLDILTERITVRELIRSRVYQEVQDFNRKAPAHF